MKIRTLLLAALVGFFTSIALAQQQTEAQVLAKLASDIAANPNNTEQIVSAAVRSNPGMEVAIVKAAIAAQPSKAVSITTSAVNAAPAKGADIKAAAAIAAPAFAAVINAIVVPTPAPILPVTAGSEKITPKVDPTQNVSGSS